MKTPEKFPLSWPQAYPVTSQREKSKFDCTMSEAHRLINDGKSIKYTIDHMRTFCETDEEFTAFVHALGY